MADEDTGGDEATPSKRKNTSPMAKGDEGLQKRRATEMATLIAKIHNGVATNSFVPDEVKEACKRLQELIERTKQMENRGTQTSKPLQMKLEIEALQIRDQLKKCENEEELETVFKKNWPKKTYESTMFVMGRIRMLAKEKLVVVITKRDEKNFKEATNMIPIIDQIDDEKLCEGLLIEREEQIKIQGLGIDGERQRGEKLLVFGLPQTPQVEEHAMLNKMRQIKERLSSMGENHFILSLPEGWDLQLARKVLEYTLIDTELKSAIVTSREQPDEPTENAIRVQTLSIPLGGKSFAETVKNLSENVNPENIGVEIRSVKEVDGKMQVALAKCDEGKAIELIDEIKNTTKIEATLQKRERGFFIYNIENEATEDEVMSELRRLAKSDTINARINMRKLGVLKSALIFTDEDTAEMIIRYGTIRRSGWMNWTIREKINPPFCMKCQRYGHNIRSCTNAPANGKRCMNCGEEGHISKECKNDIACGECKLEGHRMNSTACPVFKAYVDKEKGQRNFLR